MTLTKTVSCIELPSYIKQEALQAKRVRWSIELEEVHYFKPQKMNKRDSLGRKVKNLKHIVSGFAGRTGLNFSGLEFIKNQLRNRASVYEVAEHYDNKPWDELFDLYGGV
ncbi:predicted protein [Nematostella vectensis]|uniref:Uncharacterized protein n=1 Tax=Nematostella vectensis TaxID=45351 RepID=A7SLY8_NEMVE|nr:predicted protein [Nematostella vectensis]|eukprot:XP_001627369.1 predicted protein [Nematostella vectensis]